MGFEEREAKEMVAEAGRKLLESGLIVRTWGNISARISNDEFVITPSGKGYDTLTADDIVKVNMNDFNWEGNAKPSSEKHMHAAIYRQRLGANFIIHTHQRYASALSSLGFVYSVYRTAPESVPVLGPEVPTAHYGISSTKMLSDRVEDAIVQFPKSRAVLMQGHGAVCVGVDCDDAFRIADALEQMAQKRYAQLLGPLMPEECKEPYRDSDFYQVWLRDSGTAEGGTSSCGCTTNAAGSADSAQNEGACCTSDGAQSEGGCCGCGSDGNTDTFVVDSLHDEIFRTRPGVGCVIRTTTPFLKKISGFGSRMPVCIDDLAQYLGTFVPCLPADASDEDIAKALQGTAGGVLIQDGGAVCTGRDQDDAEAVCMVMEKGAMAALLKYAGHKIHTIDAVSGLLEHIVYTAKYAKLK